MPEPMELFFWATPNCWKITIALEEMALPYTVRPVAIGKGEQFEPAFLAISPNNRVPAIVDHDGPGGKPAAVFESGAILQYLGRKTGRFYPNDRSARLEVEQWLFWQVGGVGPMFGQASHFRNYAPALVAEPARIEYGAKRYSNETNRLLGVLDKRRDDRDFVAGDYSIADMALYPWIGYAGYLGQNIGDFPHLAAWLERVGARPAVQRGMNVGSDLRAPPPETGTTEQGEFAQALFGQTAESVAVAAYQAAQAARAGS
jgi:GSH-dependent disulfide-bond oxidoreductase